MTKTNLESDFTKAKMHVEIGSEVVALLDSMRDRPYGQYIDREIREEIKHRIRSAQNFMRLTRDRQKACVFREVGIEGAAGNVAEHVIPVSQLCNLVLERQMTVAQAIFCPVALVSLKSDSEISRSGHHVRNHDLRLPFGRMNAANVQIELPDHRQVDPASFTLQNCFDAFFEFSDYRKLMKELGASEAPKLW